jgi:hypothetical protein
MPITNKKRRNSSRKSPDITRFTAKKQKPSYSPDETKAKMATADSEKRDSGSRNVSMMDLKKCISEAILMNEARFQKVLEKYGLDKANDYLNEIKTSLEMAQKKAEEAHDSAKESQIKCSALQKEVENLKTKQRKDQSRLNELEC